MANPPDWYKARLEETTDKRFKVAPVAEATVTVLETESKRLASIEHAAMVLALDVKIRTWLRANDPQAAAQLDKALGLDQPGHCAECAALIVCQDDHQAKCPRVAKPYHVDFCVLCGEDLGMLRPNQTHACNRVGAKK